MAKKKAPQAPIEFQGYVEIRLDTAQKEAFRQWAAEQTDVFALVSEQTEAGYRFSLGWDDYNLAQMCSVTTKDRENTNAGWVLVGRGSTAERALYQALFKHLIVAKGDWLNTPTVSKNDWD